MTDWLAAANNGASAGQSIADMVAAAANEVMVDNYLPGYVYIEQYQAYYNAQSNLYYYPQTGLFYDIAKACYLRYNQFSGRYEPYAEMKKKAHWSKKRYKSKAVETYGNTTLATFDQGAVDVIETVYDLVDRVSFLAGDDEEAQRRYEKKFAASNVKYDNELGDYIASSKRKNSYHDDGSEPESEDDEATAYERRKREEREAQNPPCIRIIETHNAYRFHILTIDGGSLGCARHCTVQLPEEGAIDEEHIRIFYDYPEPSVDNTKGFWLRNDSRHAILLNDTVVTRKKTLEINHGDIMIIGDNRLIFHVHRGMNTCNGCEPGILAKEAEKQAAELKQTKKTSETARREIIHSLKQKYGLDKGQTTSSFGSSGYSDRAKVRRKIVGSEIDLPPNPNTASTGVFDGCIAKPVPGATAETVELKAVPKKRAAPTPISEENKGFKLLKSMGWTEGKGLGKAGQGAVESIATQLKADRSGIGHENKASSKAPPVKMYAKQRILEKTKERFEQLDKQS